MIEKNINFFQTSNSFPITLIDIYDYLKENYDEFFPERSSIDFTTLEKKKQLTKHIEQAYIIGSRIKLYVIKNIYNGKYIIDGKGYCPECYESGFVINTDISRLEALEFNHKSGNKIHEYTVKIFYNLFTQSYGDPHFLEKLIFKMESEKVELIY
ncbi:MAG: hypothetical protein ACFFDF_25180 [Candidatus Odinarchaeota archaeon]